MELTHTALTELLDYDPDTGLFTWKVRDRRWFKTLNAWATWNARFAGMTVVGSTKSQNQPYVRIEILGKRHKAHRLAWFWVHGRWPKAQIDHINGECRDNQLANLREATNQQNQWNGGMWSHNTSGYKGVTFAGQRSARQGRPWRAHMRQNGKLHNLGNYATKEEASAVYEAKAAELRGEFFRA